MTTDKIHNNISLVRGAWSVVAALIIIPLFFSACSKPKNEIVEGFKDAAAVPTLRSLDVLTFISDSGVTKYRITAKEWLMFDNAPDPYWLFPQGIYVEKFDPMFRTEASIKGDTATFFKNRQLWRIDGNVHIENVKKELILTEQLFWDQRSRTIYSDSFIHIEKPEEVIEGIGFVSNEQMTNYVIRQPQGICPFKRAAADSVAADSSGAVAVAPVQRTNHKIRDKQPEKSVSKK